MDVYMPPLIDAAGNIEVHGREGFVIPVKFLEPGETDVFQDISAWDLFFEVSGQYRVALAAGPDVYTRLIVVTLANVDTVVSWRNANFALVNQTPVIPETPWWGRITTDGYRGTPPGAADVTGTGEQTDGQYVIIEPDA